MDKARYPGDWRKFIPNRIVGPDTWGAWYLPVSAHYFDGYTTIFYRPVPVDKLPPHCVEISKAVVAKQHQGKEMQWPRNVSEGSPWAKSLSSLSPSPISQQSGGQPTKAAPGGSAMTKSQRELLKRFRKRV